MGNIWKKIKHSHKIQLFLLAIILTIGFLVFNYFRANPVMPQLTIYFLSDVILPDKGETVLIFSPHQDDETIACGGYIIESVKKGARVIIVLVTDGNRRSLKDLRYKEFETATGLLGVSPENLVFLDYPDSYLVQQDQQKLKEVLESQLEKFKPDVLLYPHPEDNHKDHSTIGKTVEGILAEMRDKIEDMEELEGFEDLIKEDVLEEMFEAEELAKKMVIYKYLVHHKNYPHPKRYAPDLYILLPLDLITLDGGWERLMISNETKQQKEKALRAYESQLRNPLLKNLLESSIRENEIFAIECMS